MSIPDIVRIGEDAKRLRLSKRGDLARGQETAEKKKKIEKTEEGLALALNENINQREVGPGNIAGGILVRGEEIQETAKIATEAAVEVVAMSEIAREKRTSPRDCLLQRDLL